MSSEGRFNLRSDGVIGRLLINIFSDPIMIQGVDADDDPATANPVLIGGKYIADPYADPIDDGDAGYALLNEIRMLITESRVYDPPTDADRNVPVFVQADRYDTTEISFSAAANQNYRYYIDLNGYAYFTVEAILNMAASDRSATLTYQVSDEDSQPDITARAYNSDMSLAWFGAAGYAAVAGTSVTYSHEKDTPTPWSSMRLNIAVSAGTTAGTVTLKIRKMAH
jgi:hypothetical protein